MKKNFLYMSFFAAAFLVSCKSNEVEEAPIEDVVNKEVVVEETVIVEDTIKVVEEVTTQKKVVTTKKQEKPLVLESAGKERSNGTTTSKAKEMKQIKEVTEEVSNSTEKDKVEGKKVNPQILRAKEAKENGSK